MSVVAYRIDPARSTAVELRRVIGEQLCAAATKLRVEGGPDAEAIHKARKHIKKARSGLRLARTDLGKVLVRHLQSDLRQVAADLAGARDADSLVEACDDLAASTDVGAERAAIAVLRRVLADRAEAARSNLNEDPMVAATAARTLRHTALWVSRLPPQVEGWDAIEPGLARQYERGAKAFAALGVAPDLDALHDWRKRVKDLWYHQRLLRDLWPEQVDAVARSAHDLADLLGTDHDLGLLAVLLRDDCAGVGPGLEDEDRALIDEAIERERSHLQAAARRAGARLYVDDVDPWTDRHRAWWAGCLDEASSAASQAGDIG